MSLIAARLRDRGYDDLADAFDALTAENAALRKDAEWQDIETAPKDGTDILVMYVHIETQIVHNAFSNVLFPNGPLHKLCSTGSVFTSKRCAFVT